MAYSNYKSKEYPKRKELGKNYGNKPNVKPAPKPKGHAINKANQSSVAGGTYKTMTLPGGKPAVLAEENQQNMNRVVKQPAIKVTDRDTRQKGAQNQDTDLMKGRDPIKKPLMASEIATKQKDNTVPDNAQAKFIPNPNRLAKDVSRMTSVVEKGSQQIQGKSKTATDMNYAKSAGQLVDGAGQKTQTSPGPDGAAGSKKVAYAPMKKGTKNKVKTPVAAGAGKSINAGNKPIVGTAGGDKNGHTTKPKYHFSKKRIQVTSQKTY